MNSVCYYIYVYHVIITYIIIFFSILGPHWWTYGIAPYQYSYTNCWWSLCWVRSSQRRYIWLLFKSSYWWEQSRMSKLFVECCYRLNVTINDSFIHMWNCSNLVLGSLLCFAFLVSLHIFSVFDEISIHLNFKML